MDEVISKNGLTIQPVFFAIVPIIQAKSGELIQKIQIGVDKISAL